MIANATIERIPTRPPSLSKSPMTIDAQTYIRQTRTLVLFNYALSREETVCQNGKFYDQWRIGGESVL